ncbi:MAG: putative baseplate assembly protein [Firmicutes bacterium]|nr:putative baseplate assembly protein [Bacillota bacterium]
MLPLPDLDDRTFEQMVDEARKMIPGLSPDWTDENYHDPGITFIELFAWLADMQQYYMNRIPDKNKKKFLKLLGMSFRDASPARADVTLGGVPRVCRLPAGTPLKAGRQPFETEESIVLLPLRPEKIIVMTDGKTSDFTSSNDQRGIFYYAFGREVRAGNRLYIGFDGPIPPNLDIGLTIQLFEDYPVLAEDGMADRMMIIPSGEVSWRYYGKHPSGGTPGWFPLPVTRDDTVHMCRSGRVYFKLPGAMEPMHIHPAGEKGRYWICCTVERGGYETPPRIDKIAVNTGTAVQYKTWSRVFSFSGNGMPGQVFELENYLSFTGAIHVQVRDEGGNWHPWLVEEDLSSRPGEAACVIRRDEHKISTILTFGDGKQGLIPPAGEDNIRLIAVEDTFKDERFLGMSTGLPHQVFPLPRGSVMPDGLLLQVGTRREAVGDYVWHDWEMVDDFDSSGPADRHYVLNRDTGEILFGDNEKGAIPSPSEDNNICIVSYRTGGGELGNVKEEEINQIDGAAVTMKGLSVSNWLPAGGGRERETLKDVDQKVHTELNRQHRAVTSGDYENIARATPGLRVARVRAIPLYDPGLQGYPKNTAPAQMTVVVVPYSEAKRPVPSPGFLQTVRLYLNRFRLVTTEMHVIPPEYVKIMVHAVVVVSPYSNVKVTRVTAFLEKILNPLGGTGGYDGWPFGRTVYKGDIFAAINNIDGVDYVKELWLHAEGAGARKDSSGGIQIPPHGLVYSGEHEIEIVSRDNL